MYWHAVLLMTKWLKAMIVAERLSILVLTPSVPENFRTADEMRRGSTRYTESTTWLIPTSKSTATAVAAGP